MFQLFLILYFLGLVEFQPAFLYYDVLSFWSNLSLVFPIKAVLIKNSVYQF